MRVGATLTSRATARDSKPSDRIKDRGKNRYFILQNRGAPKSVGGRPPLQAVPSEIFNDLLFAQQSDSTAFDMAVRK